ncbi:FtsX-like permease family protein [Myxococcaceae bacterium GXIMD 01537]
MFQLFLIATRNLASHGRRTLLLGGAIAGVTALLVLLLGLSLGIKSTLLRSATTLMTGHVNVGGFYKVTAGQGAPVVTGADKLLVLLREKVPELDYAVSRGRGWAKLVADNGSGIQVGLAGIDVDTETGFRKVIQVREGSLDGLKEKNTILIFEEQAKKLDVRAGNLLTLSAPTMRGTNNTVDVRVVAVAANVGLMSGFNVFLPNDTLRTLYQLSPEATGVLQLYLKDMDTIRPVQERLRKDLAAAGYELMDADPRAFFMKFETVAREGWTGQKLDITNWEDEVSFVRWTLTAMDGLFGVLIFVLLIIIALGVMNTLWIAIRERTREIGTLRAIGMQRSRVLVMFVIEALVLGLVGTTSGAALGTLGCMLLNAAHVTVPVGVQLFTMSDTLHLAVSPGAMVGSILFITGCTTAISIIPSFLAARMKPVTAMHHIG